MKTNQLDEYILDKSDLDQPSERFSFLLEIDMIFLIFSGQ